LDCCIDDVSFIRFDDFDFALALLPLSGDRDDACPDIMSAPLEDDYTDVHRFAQILIYAALADVLGSMLRGPAWFAYFACIPVTANCLEYISATSLLFALTVNVRMFANAQSRTTGRLAILCFAFFCWFAFFAWAALSSGED
jgi:hypothetical protein